MRLATLIVSTLVAASPTPAKRLTPAEKEARAFLESFDGAGPAGRPGGVRGGLARGD